MKIHSRHTALQPGHQKTGKLPRPVPFLILLLVATFSLFLWACMEAGEPTDTPEQVTRVYEAKEKFVLQAIAKVFNEKDLGKATVNADAHEVTSDYVYQGEWRTRGSARTRQINWKETEVTLTVITEKKSSAGWEMRRLLGADQYKKIFKAIETQIYREMYKTE
ncbi:MAG: hypothetical protein HPY65_09895 [Syntrophaceae bacterium]|nr:hypothetical protein [Syntrophaceae bacterium]